MAQNTSPIFTLVPNFGWGGTDGNGGATNPLKTANTAMDGTGTVLTVFTAGSEGSFVRFVRCRPAGTNIASVIRVFINNGSTNATATNNILFDEISLPASTASATNNLVALDLPLGIAIPAGYKINVTIGTTVSAGYYVSCPGGNY